MGDRLFTLGRVLKLVYVHTEVAQIYFCLGDILGGFFANSSGHPVQDSLKIGS
jgi:hypothetical protein